MTISAHRILDHPILTAHQAGVGGNINGPSLIKVPDWMVQPLGRYYLYFGHHFGDHIRMAYADDLRGPWRIYEGGVLHLAQTPLPTERPDVPQPQWAVARGVDGLYPHISSPDVHVDAQQHLLIMYLHGLDHDGEQRSLRATSRDGVKWCVDLVRIEQTYLRAFRYCDTIYAMGWGGQILKHRTDGGFDLGPWSFGHIGLRHAGVMVRDSVLHVVWTRIGDAPEHILHSTIDLSGDWLNWRAVNATTLMVPQYGWEGVDVPISPSEIGGLTVREHALRDPYLFLDDGHVYLAYAGGGETALGLAEVSGGF